MNKKILVQIALFLSLIIIIFLFYYKYFFLKKEESNIANLNQNNKIVQSENNLIKNLEYLSTDKKGNKYLITAEYGQIDSPQSGIILMTNVKAKIDYLKKDTIYLTSDYAVYNTINLDTDFNKNVIIHYTEHEITSENVDLSLKENLVSAYNNVVYKNSMNQLFADKLEIDLLTKDSKIFMYKNKKVKIIGK